VRRGGAEAPFYGEGNRAAGGGAPLWPSGSVGRGNGGGEWEVKRGRVRC
jgi:hypothetical protein